MTTNNISDVIKSLRDADGYIETIFMSGSCYQFHLFLKQLFPSCIPYATADHVVSFYNGKYYDITGEVNGEYQPMTAEKKAEAEKWSFSKNMMLQLTECPNCGEPIIV